MILKSTLLFIIILTVNQSVMCQTFNEWFNQKKTQHEYLIAQILALEVYGSHLQKGYETVKVGSDMITGLRDGEFVLHRNYFNGLKGFSNPDDPYFKIADILQQVKVLNSEVKRAKDGVRSLDHNQVHQRLFNQSYSALLSETAGLLGQYLTVLDPKSLEMTDRQRLGLVDNISTELSNLVRDLVSFNNLLNDFLNLYTTHSNSIKYLETLIK